jgi:hypothetical protein
MTDQSPNETPVSERDAQSGSINKAHQNSESTHQLLYEVLEKEYISMHGPLSEEYKTTKARYMEEHAGDKKLLNEKLLPEIYKLIYALETKRSALCLSGGGIRSATFCLGVIQGLARCGFLDKFDYLSTVSGGGYIGSWLTAYIHRHPRGIEGVLDELRNDKPQSKIEPEPEPLQSLRDYSNFITPKLGLLSADFWSFGAIIVRNLILNWLALIPLILAVLMLPRVLMGINLAYLWPNFAQFFAWGFFLGGLFCSAFVVAYMRLNRPSSKPPETDRVKHKAPGESFRNKPDNQHNFLRFCLIPLLCAAFLLTTFWAWAHNPANNIVQPFSTLIDFRQQAFLGFVLFGYVVHVLALFIHSVLARRWPKWWQFILVPLPGIVGGILLWFFATKIFPLPVNAHFISYAAQIAPEPVNALKGQANVLPFYLLNAQPGLYACFATPLFLATYFLATTFFVGISSRNLFGQDKDRDWKAKLNKRMTNMRMGKIYGSFDLKARFAALVLDDEDREWLARFSAWTLIAMLVWSVFHVLVIFGPVYLSQSPRLITALGGVSGLLAILGGRSSKTPANEKQASKSGIPIVASLNILALLSLLAYLFLIILVIVLSYATSLLMIWLSTQWPAIWGPATLFSPPLGTLSGFDGLPFLAYRKDTSFDLWAVYWVHWWASLLLGAILAVFGLIASRIINLNRFSLHAGYRERLIRAYLGATRKSNERRENPFTGFDPRDNIYMHELRPELLHERDFIDDHGQDLTDSFLKKLKRAEEDLSKRPPDALQQQPPVDANQHGTLGEMATPSPQVAVSEFLVASLSDITKQLLKDYEASRPPTDSLKKALIEDLNQILETSDLHLQEPFRHLQLSAKTEATRRRFEETKRDDYRILLNRLLLEEAYPREIARSKYPPPPYKLMHVINMTLNLVHGKKLAWQQRKAESFTCSPLHCGSMFVGYRPTKDYGGDNGISLGTAVAISGAAASSNMGYLSVSTAVTFLMTLFNTRLGWWLGNPGPSGEAYYHLAYPNSAIYPIVSEALGLTDDQNAYVLLSDGGHFENLGLYEMVMRRCHTIVVVEGSQDSNFEFGDMGNAVRKIRIDLGIPIEFYDMQIHKRETVPADKGKYCALGRIDYQRVDGPEAQNGVVLYIKPSYYGNEPRDVVNYAITNANFPHESTADLWFSEAQFESYRRLGSYIMDLICYATEQPQAASGGGDKKSQETAEHAIGAERALQPLEASAMASDLNPLRHLIRKAHIYLGKQPKWVEEWLNLKK